MASVGLFQTAFILGLEFVGPSKRVMFGVIGEFFFAFGEIILGLMAWGIRSWRMLQLVISAPVTCFVFYYWIVPESIRWLQTKGRHAQVVANLENIARINKKTIPLHLLRHHPLEEAESDESNDMAILINRPHKVTLLDVFRNPTMAFRTIFLIIIWITTTLTYYGLSYNAMDLGEDQGANKIYLNFLLSAVIEIPGYIFAWIGMEYFGRKWSLLISLFLSGIACIATGYLKGFLSMLLIFLVGKSNITTAFAIIYVYTAELFPTNVRNTVIGLCSMFARVGGMIAPFSTSLKQIYTPLPMLLFGLLSLLSSLLSITMPETLGEKLPDTIKDAIHIGSK
ncbi:Organic cation transporter protein [Armadillidium nasatum]|uniref:Organic cation transporter protein n=1 Tax=Armadillidium nasatum TaxID=96803 RepID=A0A5N5TKU5_9CRUS|nr:Organic cation transporter protein [Armadillidium nasatum]